MSTLRLVHVAMEFWGTLFFTITAICLFFIRSFDKDKRRILFLMQVSSAVLLCMDALAWLFRGYPGQTGYYMVRITNFLVFFVTDMIVLLFHCYVWESIKYTFEEERKPLFRIRLVYVIIAAAVVMLLISQFTNLYYYFDADNFYHRQSAYPLCMLFGWLCAVIDTTILLQYRARIKRETLFSLCSYVLLLFFASVALLFFYGISLVNMAIALSMLFLFMMAIMEQNQILKEQEAQIYDMKVALLRSQIKPHFIFNTLTAIRYLCSKDQEEAVHAIDEFASYLYGNMESIGQEGTIPFGKELEHVKNYVAVEKRRFKDRIRVEYEIEESGFKLPALTLQPLVENAIKHGITQKEEGGTVWIHTFREKNKIILEIRDNGVGYDPAKPKEDGRVHVGLKNIRKRLSYLCKAQLTITSAPGQGCTVRVIIPVE